MTDTAWNRAAAVVWTLAAALVAFDVWLYRTQQAGRKT